MTAKYINPWLKPFFKKLLRLLGKHPDYRFVLDGQTLIVENYLNLLSKKEAHLREKEIRKFVKQGRLKIGPNYMAPDYSIPGGETLIRNILVGHRIARRFGNVMKVGWLLDPFGLPSQTPQLHQGFGIESIFLWRGVPIEPEKLRSEWWWHSPDGSKTLTVYLADSYRNVMGLATFPELAEDRIIAEAEKLACFSSFEPPVVLLMDGYDLDPTPDDIAEMVGSLNRKLGKRIKLALATPEEYLKVIKKKINSQKVRLFNFSGSLYSGRYNAVFPGVLSARIYLKQKNEEIERLFFWAEFLSALSWTKGGSYWSDVLWQNWKTFLRNQPHDSICGVSIDEVHRGMMKRYHRVQKSLEKIIREQIVALAGAVDTFSKDKDDKVLVVFNPSPWPRKEVVKFWLNQSVLKKGSVLLKDDKGKHVSYQLGKKRKGKAGFYFSAEVPCFGCRSYFLSSALTRAPRQKPVAGVEVSEKDRTIENRNLKVKINPNGSLDILDKKTGKYYKNLGYFEDGGDAGDEYNYSPPKKDKVITSLDRKAKIELLDKGPLLAGFRIELELSLPISLTKNRVSRSGKTRAYPIVCYVFVAKDSSCVDFEVAVNNVVKDHRLRVCFPSFIKTNSSFAKVQFGMAKYPILPKKLKDISQIPEKIRRTLIGQRETVPITWHPQRGFVDLNDGQVGLAVIAPGLPCYEVLKKNNTIALTLLRSVGWLARGDLLTREGDAGPAILTPEAQCLGKHTFSYSIFPHRGDWLKAKVHQKTEERRLPLKSVLTDVHSGKLSKNLTFFELKTKPAARLIVTTVKKSEDGNSLVVRLYNTSDKRIRTNLQMPGVRACYLANFDEEIKKKLKKERDGNFSFWVRGNQIITLKMEIEKENILKKKQEPQVVSLLKPLSFIEDVLFPESPPPIVTLTDIKKEKARIKKIKLELKKARKKLARLKGKTKTIKSRFVLEKTKNKVYALERTLLEAEISLLLVKKELIMRENSPLKKEKIRKVEKALKKIGNKFNPSRVKRRLSDFLVAYWDYRAKQEGNSPLNS